VPPVVPMCNAQLAGQLIPQVLVYEPIADDAIREDSGQLDRTAPMPDV
jgi:hypothetical protein